MIELLLTICSFTGVCEPSMVDALEHLKDNPEAAPVVSTVYRGMGDDAVEQWRPLVSAYFDADEVDRALCLIKHESGGNPDAKNPRSTARGLMQILTSLWGKHFNLPAEAFYDPETNIRAAKRILDMQGWGAWSPYNRGLCR